MNNFFNKKGFTLIELLTSMAIFLIIIGGASGVLIFSIQAQRKASASQELLSQTSFLIEYMSRALRMARKDIGAQCISGKMNYQITVRGGIKFLNYQGQCQEFYLEEGQLKEEKGGTVSDLTSNELQIESFNVIDSLEGGSWSQEDDEQPRATLFLETKGRGEREELQPEIKIQTTISQRQLDVQY